MQQIGTGPIGKRWVSASAVITGERSRASSVMPPSRTNTGTEAKTVPLPVVEDMSGKMKLLRLSRKPRIVHHLVRRKGKRPILPPVEPQAKDSTSLSTS